ncbi:MAG: hypothetical protein QOD84_1488 [Acidobacteriaceae bacterium]|jgi:hypothetical protein
MLTLRADILFCALILCLPALSQTESPKSPSSQAAHHKQQASAAGEGVLNGAYRNPAFGFTYKVPFGWEDRTQDMQQSSDEGTSKVLLAIFQRPPETRGEEINAAVVIASESASSYRGLKTAADYFGPLQELTIAKGFKVIRQPYVFSLGAKALVRGDFSKPRGNLTMYQSSLVILEKGTIVSFTFIAGSEDEVNGLIENLSFGVGKRAR